MNGVASATLPLRLRRSRRLRLRQQTVAATLVLVVVAGLVLSPIGLLVANSFQVAAPGVAPAYGLDAWRAALTDDRLLASLGNTVLLTVVVQAISLVAAIPLAWLIARTDLPWADRLEFLFWIAFFLPALPVLLGWILLLDPHYGLLNQALAGLPVGLPLFNIYSFAGIVWAHLAREAIALKVILLVPALRNLDASLEEASRMSGAGVAETLLRVVVPVLAPVVAIVLLLSVVGSLQTFEVEVVLGVPARFFVFSSMIYVLLHQEPALYGQATVLGTLVLGLILLLVVVQRRVIERRRYTTLSGQFRKARTPLRRWRFPAFGVVLAVALTTTVLPLVMLLVGTFMKLFGFFNLPQPWTLGQWTIVLKDPTFLSSLWNTAVVAAAASTLGVVGYTTIAYVSVRTRFGARGLLDLMGWLPASLPGVILGLGLLWVLLGTPLLRPVYGTLGALVLGVVIAHMTLGIQTIKGPLIQIGADLEEAARVTGGSWWDDLRYVVLPLMAPALVLAAALTFVLAARDVSTVALLATSSSSPLALLQLQYMTGGHYEAATVIGVIVVALTTGVALAARAFGSRFGLALFGGLG